MFQQRKNSNSRLCLSVSRDECPPTPSHPNTPRLPDTCDHSSLEKETVKSEPLPEVVTEGLPRRGSTNSGFFQNDYNRKILDGIRAIKIELNDIRSDMTQLKYDLYTNRQQTEEVLNECRQTRAVVCDKLDKLQLTLAPPPAPFPEPRNSIPKKAVEIKRLTGTGGVLKTVTTTSTRPVIRKKV